MRRVELSEVELLPYNASAGAKYDWLDREYAVEGEPRSAEVMSRMRDASSRHGPDARRGVG